MMMCMKGNSGSVMYNGVLCCCWCWVLWVLWLIIWMLDCIYGLFVVSCVVIVLCGWCSGVFWWYWVIFMVWVGFSMCGWC